MFYNINDLKSILCCKKCNERLDEARALPCGSIICNYCAKSLNLENDSFECIVCNESHHNKKSVLPINKEITELIKLEPVKVSRGRSHDKLEQTLKSIDDIYNQIKLGLTNGTCCIKEYCSNLKNELQLAKEEHIQALEEYNQTLLNEIDKYENERISKLETKSALNDELNEMLKELKEFNEKSSEYLNNNIIDDVKIDEINLNGEQLLKKAKEKNILLDCKLFDNKFKFTRCTKPEFKRIFGKLNTKLDSLILDSEKIIEELLNLCKFDLNQKWNLIYRASRDGFAGRDFHSKCDKQKNTLIVIQSTNGNIFGGYTEQDWFNDSGYAEQDWVDYDYNQPNRLGASYKYDSEAILFSLKNIQNTPIIFFSSTFNDSIYCKNNFGPTFGSGPDLCICDNSNIINSSYSKLGCSYANQNFYFNGDIRSFLAGSSKFLTTEIEVFTKAFLNC